MPDIVVNVKIIEHKATCDYCGEVIKNASPIEKDEVNKKYNLCKDCSRLF